MSFFVRVFTLLYSFLFFLFPRIFHSCLCCFHTPLFTHVCILSILRFYFAFVFFFFFLEFYKYFCGCLLYTPFSAILPFSEFLEFALQSHTMRLKGDSRRFLAHHVLEKYRLLWLMRWLCTFLNTVAYYRYTQRTIYVSIVMWFYFVPQ